MPDSGEILYDGNTFSSAQRNSMGYLPEERGLYRKSSLLNTLTYFAALHGMKDSEARAHVRHWLLRFGLEGEETKRIQELSKGNQQKAQFIAAVVHDPWLLVLDEPFSGLDPLNQALMQEIIGELKRSGKAIVLSTHQMEFAEKLSDTICLIHEGRMLLSGSVEDIKKPYGGSTLRIECDGSELLPLNIPGVSSMRRFRDGAECDLESGTTVGQVLARLIQHVDIRKCEVVEPTLHSIFIDVVRSQNSASPTIAVQ
jgi:ABC-2 type transport system ATP-binding protein